MSEPGRRSQVRERRQSIAAARGGPPVIGGSLTLRDGAVCSWRAIRADDAERLRAFHSRLSHQTLFYRFFGEMPVLSRELAERLCQVNYRDAGAFGVGTGAGQLGGGSLVERNLNRWTDRCLGILWIGRTSIMLRHEVAGTEHPAASPGFAVELESSPRSAGGGVRPSSARSAAACAQRRAPPREPRVAEPGWAASPAQRARRVDRLADRGVDGRMRCAAGA